MTSERAWQAPIQRRDPVHVMRLERLGSFHQTRLSFMRQLTRRMKGEGWRFDVPVFEIDARGVGHAVYRVDTGQNIYSLVAFAHDLPPELRSDRVIAEAWDATFTLFDGTPGAADIARLKENVPYQEAGRIGETELTLARANRSARLWDHVVTRLAAGVQPDLQMIASVGYLMRTTAVYGSGKFGAADRERVSGRPECQAPFQVEMLTVYLIRTFVRDLVEHMARSVGGAQAVPLDPAIARSIGIGNSTGLGMAPFLINHPVLFNNWIMVREEAIARVRTIEAASEPEQGCFLALFKRSKQSALDWHSSHPVQIERIRALATDLASLEAQLPGIDWADRPWDRLFCWANRYLGLEAQEWLGSLMLEPYGDLIDGLAHCMADGAAPASIDGAKSLASLLGPLEQQFGWALGIDWQAKASIARAWYVSEEKLEPRLGERFEEPLEPFEQPLAPARDAAALYRAIKNLPGDTLIAAFLLTNPEHRHMVRRIQTAARAPYGEIHDNTIAATMLPIDMLRCKLSYFGATHFDPRSDRWVRICMYGNAPYPDELAVRDADFWPYPAEQGGGG